jgi:hypothetical protein
MTKVRTFLLLGSALALAACNGANDIASPGEGVIVVPAPAPAPAPAPTPSPTPTPSPGPAADCPAPLVAAGQVANRLICQLSGTYTGPLRLRNLRGVVYALNGRVNIGQDQGSDPDAPIAGATAGILTIDPGVKIFGSSGADSLVINRGSQIFAEGTPTNPIIITARANMEGSTNADSIGLWGGLVLLGRAPIHTCISPGATPGSAACQNNIEGLTNAFYGGARPLDNSGRIDYFQIRYPGFEVAPGNELNGITMGGVGSGTFMEHIQVHNSSDDGMEWFGGRNNHRFLVITGADDDSVDTDLGYQGFMQFVVVVQRATGGDRIIEAETSGFELRTPRSFPRVVNFTFVNRRSPAPILLRGGTDYALVNGLVSATAATCLQVNDAQTIAAANPALDERGPPIFRSVLFGCATPAAAGAGVDLALVTAAITGNNNVLTYVPTLTDSILPGATETAAVATNPTFLGGPLTFANYVGAFQNAADRWFNGWTCGLVGQISCEAVPADNGI